MTCKDDSQIFIPDWKTLEKIYQKLQLDAGCFKKVSCDDSAILSKQKKHNAQLITMYVRARQKEDILSGRVVFKEKPVLYSIIFTNELSKYSEINLLYKHSDIAIIRSR